MDDQFKRRLTRRSIWMRGLYMVLLAIAWGVARIVLTLTVLLQFLTVLFTGGANPTLLRFGHNLGIYVLEIIAFLTFNSEHRPFPFADWRDEDPGDNPWLHGGPEPDDGPEPEPEEETGTREYDTTDTAPAPEPGRP
jgi:hypothetical protein